MEIKKSTSKNTRMPSFSRGETARNPFSKHCILLTEKEAIMERECVSLNFQSLKTSPNVLLRSRNISSQQARSDGVGT